MQFIWPLSQKRITTRSKYMPGWKIVNNEIFCLYIFLLTGSVTEWLSCWTHAQEGPGSNRSSNAVG